MIGWIRKRLRKRRLRRTNPWITPSMVEIPEEYKRAMRAAKRRSILEYQETMRAFRETNDQT
jgi:hypothetical protein